MCREIPKVQYDGDPRRERRILIYFVLFLFAGVVFTPPFPPTLFAEVIIRLYLPSSDSFIFETIVKAAVLPAATEFQIVQSPRVNVCRRQFDTFFFQSTLYTL